MASRSTITTSNFIWVFFVLYTRLQWTTVNRRLQSMLIIVTAIWATRITMINWIDSHIIFPFIPFTQISRNGQSSAQHKNNNCVETSIVGWFVWYVFFCSYVHPKCMETNKMKMNKVHLLAIRFTARLLAWVTESVIKSQMLSYRVMASLGKLNYKIILMFIRSIRTWFPTRADCKIWIVVKSSIKRSSDSSSFYHLIMRSPPKSTNRYAQKDTLSIW